MRSGQVQYEEDLRPLMVPIDDVKQHPQNANNGDVEAIMESIMEFGMYDAIKVSRESKEIVAGNHTWLACKELGAEVVPVIWLDGDEVANIQRMLADNKIAQMARTDEGQLLILLSELEVQDALPGTGYIEDDLKTLRALEKVPVEFMAADHAPWPTLCFQVPPHVKAAFYEITEGGHGDKERLELLLHLAGWDG